MDIFQKPKILTYIIIALLLLNFGTLAFLWFHKPPKPNREFVEQHEMNKPGEMNRLGEMRGFLEDQLNFNDKQREEFNKLRDEHHKALMVIQDTIKSLKDRMFDQLILNSQDSLKVNSLAASIGDAQKQIELITYNHFQKVRALCDNEQKQKFDKIMKDVVRALDMRPPHDGMEMHHPPEMEMRHGLPPPPK